MLVKEAKDTLEETGFIYKKCLQFSNYNYHFFLRSNILVSLEEALRFNLEGKVNMIRLHGSVLFSNALYKAIKEANLNGGRIRPAPNQYREEFYLNLKLHPQEGCNHFRKTLLELMKFKFSPQSRYQTWIQEITKTIELEV